MPDMIKQTKLAERGALLSIGVYIFIAFLKLTIGTLFHSASLSADGWNNFTDVLSSLAIYIGLRVARQPADQEHQYGHWKAESIASLMSSFIMFFIGIQVALSAINGLVKHVDTPLDPLVAITSLIAGLFMFATYFYNKRLATRIQSSGLKATAKNNLSDALTSLATTISILCSYIFKVYWLDTAMAIVVALIILHTAFEVFKESAFILSDGFNTKELEPFKQCILNHPEIHDISSIKARSYGANVYIDVTVLMNPDLTVKQSHDVTEEIEHDMLEKFNVHYMDIHVEPSQITKQEV